MAPRPDGGLFVSIQAPESAVLASLDAAGQVRPGWPIVLAGSSRCQIAADPKDGSLRAVCATPASGARAFAYDDAGRLLAGWPVDISGGFVDEWGRYRPRLVEGQLYLVLGSGSPASAWLVRVSADGSVRTGASLPGPGADESYVDAAIAPDGTAYVMAYAYAADGSAIVTVIAAADLAGLKPGWPIRVGGEASAPSLGPDGRIYLTVGQPGGSASQLLAFARDGKAVPGWPVNLPVAAPSVWSGHGQRPPAAPVVARDGSAYLVTEEGGFPGGGTTAYAIDATGALRAGWPYRSSTGLVWNGYITPCAIGGGLRRSDPVAAPNGGLYLLHQVARGGTGGSIVAIGRDGAVKAGWPVVLRRAGAEFSSVAVGPDGTAFALAIEPERHEDTGCGAPIPLSSATILAIEPDGTVRYRVTVAEP